MLREILAPARRALLLTATIAFSSACASSQQQTAGAQSAPVVPVAIAERMYVPIGGIEQWVTITGDDRTNPVILVLHGGPGNPMSPFGDALFDAWESDFTIVQWDQRGAGRTFTRAGAEASQPMTVERMAQDGVELAEFLRTHLQQEKIILFSTSWGSVLGIHMAHARPDLFHAYVGQAQLVQWDANMLATYARLVELARAGGDEATIDTLTEIGPPPWSTVRTWPRFRRIYVAYQARLMTATPAPLVMNPDYASAEEEVQYTAAEDFSFEHLWGMTLSGPLTQVDLPALGRDFRIPIYVIQGEQDLWTTPDLARAYIDSINAPEKQFFIVEGAGHELSVTGMDLIHRVLLERVAPRIEQR